MRDTEFLGHKVPKGTICVFTHAMSLNEENDSSENIYEIEKEKVGMKQWKKGTSHKFEPERWLNEKGKFDIESGSSMPFGGGHRGCFGKALGVCFSKLIF